MNISLYSAISNNLDLNDEQIEKITEILGYHCRENTKWDIKVKLKNLKEINNQIIFSRMKIYNNDAEYVAGQCRKSEIKTIRNLILY